MSLFWKHVCYFANVIYGKKGIRKHRVTYMLLMMCCTVGPLVVHCCSSWNWMLKIFHVHDIISSLAGFEYSEFFVSSLKFP